MKRGEKGDRSWRWRRKRFSPGGAEVVEETMICQYERLSPKPSWARDNSPGTTFPAAAAHEQGEVFCSSLGCCRQGWQVRQRPRYLPRTQQRTLAVAKSPALPPSTRQKHSAGQDTLQPTASSKPRRNHLVSFLSSTCKCSTTHSACSQGFMSLRSTRKCSRL